MFKAFQHTQQAFEEKKASLTSPPLLGHPDFQYPFIVYTDASGTELGAILAQRKDQGCRVGFGKMAALPGTQTLHMGHGFHQNYQPTHLLGPAPAKI